MKIAPKSAENNSLSTAEQAGQEGQSHKPPIAELLPAYQRARALNVRGYGNVMLPLIPCGAPVSGQSRPANGKVPGEWNGTNWRNAWNWTKATSIDLGTWKTLPAGTGIGIRTGFGPVAFDIDIKVDPSSMAPHDVQARRLAAEIRNVLMRAIVGTPDQNALRLVGKLAPTGIVSGALSGGVGYQAAGPIGAVAIPATGYVARKGAERMQDGFVQELVDIIMAGGNKSATQVAPNRLQSLIDANRNTFEKSAAAAAQYEGSR